MPVTRVFGYILTCLAEVLQHILHLHDFCTVYTFARFYSAVAPRVTSRMFFSSAPPISGILILGTARRENHYSIRENLQKMMTSQRLHPPPSTGMSPTPTVMCQRLRSRQCTMSLGGCFWFLQIRVFIYFLNISRDHI